MDSLVTIVTVDAGYPSFIHIPTVGTFVTTLPTRYFIVGVGYITQLQLLTLPHLFDCRTLPTLFCQPPPHILFDYTHSDYTQTFDTPVAVTGSCCLYVAVTHTLPHAHCYRSHVCSRVAFDYIPGLTFTVTFTFLVCSRRSSSLPDSPLPCGLL